MNPCEGQLLYDSVRSGARLAARGEGAEARTLFFRCGDTCVDLLLQEGGEDLRILHGQLIKSTSGTPLTGVVIEIGAEHVVSDEHGEFAVSVMDGMRPRLRVCVPAAEFTCVWPDEDEA